MSCEIGLKKYRVKKDSSLSKKSFCLEHFYCSVSAVENIICHFSASLYSIQRMGGGGGGKPSGARRFPCWPKRYKRVKFERGSKIKRSKVTPDRLKIQCIKIKIHRFEVIWKDL